MSRITVTIDQLVLNGFEGGDRKPLVDGLQVELSRLLADSTGRAEWARSHRTPVLKLGRIPIESVSTGARKFGTGLARAVGRGLKP